MSRVEVACRVIFEKKQRKTRAKFFCMAVFENVRRKIKAKFIRDLLDSMIVNPIEGLTDEGH